MMAAYETREELNTAQGLYMMVWFVFTVIMTMGAVRCSVGLFLVCESHSSFSSFASRRS